MYQPPAASFRRGFGWRLFQGSSETEEGDTPQSHCLLLLTAAHLCYHSSVVLFSFIFCSASVICPKCILKQNQLLALHLLKRLSRPSLGPAIFSGAGCQRLLILKLTVASEVFFNVVFRILYSWCRKCSDYTYRFFKKGRRVGKKCKIPGNSTIWSIC